MMGELLGFHHPLLSPSFSTHIPSFLWVFESNYSSCTIRSSEIICKQQSSAVQCRRSSKRKLSLPPKLVEELVWVPLISFCKVFIPSYTRLMPYYAETGRFSAPNCLTLLRITLSLAHLGGFKITFAKTKERMNLLLWWEETKLEISSKLLLFM
jgi:hypothetical protein